MHHPGYQFLALFAVSAGVGSTVRGDRDDGAGFVRAGCKIDQ